MDISRFFVDKHEAMLSLAVDLVNQAATQVYVDSSGDLTCSGRDTVEATQLLHELMAAYSWVEQEKNFKLLDAFNPRFTAAKEGLGYDEDQPYWAKNPDMPRTFVGNSWFPLFRSVCAYPSPEMVKLFEEWPTNHAFQAEFFTEVFSSSLALMAAMNYLDCVSEGNGNANLARIVCCSFMRLAFPVILSPEEAVDMATRYLIIHKCYNPVFDLLNF